MNERDAMNPDAMVRTAPRPQQRPQQRAELGPHEQFIRALCRKANVGYSTDGHPGSWAEQMRRRLRDADEATARLDCVIFAGLISPGLAAAGAGRSMRRAISVRERMRECGYWLVRPVAPATSDAGEVTR